LKLIAVLCLLNFELDNYPQLFSLGFNLWVWDWCILDANHSIANNTLELGTAVGRQGWADCFPTSFDKSLSISAQCALQDVGHTW
jgi:hypothetical protein